VVSDVLGVHQIAKNISQKFNPNEFVI